MPLFYSFCAYAKRNSNTVVYNSILVSKCNLTPYFLIQVFQFRQITCCLTRQVAAAQRERSGENYFPCGVKHTGVQVCTVVAWQRDYKDDVQE
jgi:hypothetical protein